MALAILRRVQRGAFAAPVLRSTLAELDNPRDRAFITDLVYGTLRHLPFLDAALAPRLRAPQRLPDEIRWILRTAAYELLIRGTARHAAVHSWVAVSAAHNRQLSGLVNAVLRRLEPPTSVDEATAMRLPPWLASALQASLGGASSRAAAAMLEAQRLWVMAYHESATTTLVEDGCEVSPGPVPGLLQIRCSKPLADLAAFQNGSIQPQNPASAVAALELAPAWGATTYDLAGGNGIKAAQLAHHGAAVVSIEIDSRKIESAARNLHRLGLSVEHRQADLTQVPDLPPAPYVLLDAPCSGSGTLRGHPEIKMRLRPTDVTALTALQSRMLDTAAALTEPGGQLVYSVCSLIAAEGHQQIQRFLEQQPSFSIEPLATQLDSVATPVGAYLIPSNGLDGFFLSHLRKDPSG